jgi:lipopolysaccharide export system protein LptA
MRRVFLTLGLFAAFCAWAEKGDKDKPTQIEANRMSADDTRRMTIFEGSVVLTKGTIAVRADRIVVRQDAEGYQFTTATGAPVRFKQKQDPKEGEKEGRWMDGEALRIEIDDRKQTIELFDNARVNRGGDEVAGNYIYVDQRSDFFSVSAGKGSAKEGQPPGRVRATIQPKSDEKK